MNETINIQKILNSPSAMVYFIGIGGIGMSAIARYFHSRDVEVQGYDKAQTELTRQLESEGIKIHYEENVNLIPKEVDLVVYTPAIPIDHRELVYYQNNGYNVVKRSDVLQAITNESFNVCVAGTHGKTTISTMVAHVLRHSGYGCNAFLGGVSVNYQTNFWSSENNVCVVEADEYDRSFLKLSPNIAVITAMDADHLDIYGDEKTMQDAFVEFGNNLKQNGLLLNKFSLRRTKEVNASRRLTYSLQNESADVFASDIQMKNGTYQFNVQLPEATINNLDLNVGGMHNLENAVAAIAVANELKIDEDKIKGAVKDFKGVKRRFEYVIAPKQQQTGAYTEPVLIDDYAHHPEELKALLKSARSLFPQRKIIIIFQPHTYTRTRDLVGGFAESLQLADEVILLPIYPARELPIEGVSSEVIFKRIDSVNKRLTEKEELLRWMEKHVNEIDKEFGEVIITAGAGDIDALVQPLKQIIERAQ
ncbi:MAG: UDP-N-acetylmuramate--L-alanine ligase [Chitinophagaceae bacterium]|nr:UDP-N-acetylmuramate--L-alanine ligase [Chitinophagaceae bacterium]